MTPWDQTAVWGDQEKRAKAMGGLYDQAKDWARQRGWKDPDNPKDWQYDYEQWWKSPIPPHLRADNGESDLVASAVSEIARGQHHSAQQATQFFKDEKREATPKDLYGRIKPPLPDMHGKMWQDKPLN
jgi:hypothetical protein